MGLSTAVSHLEGGGPVLLRVEAEASTGHIGLAQHDAVFSPCCPSNYCWRSRRAILSCAGGWETAQHSFSITPIRLVVFLTCFAEQLS